MRPVLSLRNSSRWCSRCRCCTGHRPETTDRCPANSISVRGRRCLKDAAAIARIYNEGIADRIATFDTVPGMTEQVAAWFRPGVLIVVGEADGAGVVGFAASFPYSVRPCYAGIGEYSVYAARAFRGRGVGRAALAALIEAARSAGLHKLTSRIFPENTASRALMRRFGFSEIGIHKRHGQLEGAWRDCVIVELLIEKNSR